MDYKANFVSLDSHVYGTVLSHLAGSLAKSTGVTGAKQLSGDALKVQIDRIIKRCPTLPQGGLFSSSAVDKAIKVPDLPPSPGVSRSNTTASAGVVGGIRGFFGRGGQKPESAEQSDEEGDDDFEDAEDGLDTEEKVDIKSGIKLTPANIQAISAVADLLKHFAQGVNVGDANKWIGDLTLRLCGYLGILTDAHFEERLTWSQYAPTDLLSYKIVDALLTSGQHFEAQKAKVFAGIETHLSKLSTLSDSADAAYISTLVLPSLNGCIRAIGEHETVVSMSLYAFSRRLRVFLAPDRLRNIRRAINTVVKIDPKNADVADENLDRYLYARRHLAKYWNSGTPLSANYVVYAILQVLTKLTAALIADRTAVKVVDGKYSADHIDDPWEALVQRRIRSTFAVDANLRGELEGCHAVGVQYYSEMKGVVDDFVSKRRDLSTDLYAREGMAVGLNLSTVALIALNKIDEPFINTVADALVEAPHTPDVKVQVAALDAATIHALNLPDISPQMTRIVRRFITTPSPIFDLNVRVKKDTSILDVAIQRVAQCLRAYSPIMSPTFDEKESSEDAAFKEIVMSTIYSLINVLSAGTSQTPNLITSNNVNGIGLDDAKIGMSGQTEDQKRQVSANAIWTVAGLVVEFNDPKTTALTVTMLTQRLRYHQPSIDAVIVRALVDVAPIAPYKAFIDIIKGYSFVSKQSNDGDKALADATIDAQTRLASRMGSKLNYCDSYLRELLALFVEKGTAIQATGEGNRLATVRRGSGPSPQATALIDDLRRLLTPIDTLLALKDFKPHSPAKGQVPDDLVTLFRNFWFFSVLYGFVPADSKMLKHIAFKTPALISETTTNYLESDLEYNTVLRVENPQTGADLTALRRQLSGYIPSHAGEIRSFSLPQTVFLLSVYHVEVIQAKNGQIASILRYFVNRGLNSSGLIGCMSAIADLVTSTFVDSTSQNTITHRLDDSILMQVRDLLVGACHRHRKVHELSLRSSDKVISSFPSLLCDTRVLFVYLECLDLLYKSCEGQLIDEYAPVYQFHSPTADIHLELSDSYTYRNEILSQLYEKGRKWLSLALARAPVEIQGALQKYIHEDAHEYGEIQMGRSVAIEVGKAISKSDLKLASLPKLGGWTPDNSSDFFGMFSAKEQYRGQIDGITYWAATQQGTKAEHHVLRAEITPVKQELQAILKRVLHGESLPVKELADALHRGAGVAIAVPEIDYELLQQLVWIPFHVFTPNAIKVATSIWIWLISDRPDFEAKVMTEVISGWGYTVRSGKGLFSNLADQVSPMMRFMEYSPSDKAQLRKNQKQALFLLNPHTALIQFLSSRFQALRYRSSEMVHLFLRLVQLSFESVDRMSKHPLAREARFALALLGLQLLQASSMEALLESRLRGKIYRATLSWFELTPCWSFGGNQQQVQTEIRLLQQVFKLIENDQPRLSHVLSSFDTGASDMVGDRTKAEIVKEHPQFKKLLLLLIESELVRLSVWNNPQNEKSHHEEIYSAIEKGMSDNGWKYGVRLAWSISPALAINLPARFKSPTVLKEVRHLLRKNPVNAVHIPEAVEMLLGERLETDLTVNQLKYLLYWSPAPPITLVTYFQPAYNNDPLLLQYAMRALESFPIELVFFYVPQLVQALRDDPLGYVERFILDAAKISQLFAHQIIWNMRANSWKDDEEKEPDSLKPALDRVIDSIVHALSGEDKDFYKREFAFFSEVTDISGKLKPYIKKSKPEKKAKIDEEMAKIVVDVGVYLPSNPDGVVVDIDKKSGRPLQSHAKAPYMATFKIRKQIGNEEEDTHEMVKSDNTRAQLQNKEEPRYKEVWQAAIFKVGDDVRQDVLALQLIAMFKNIFADVGLDVYLYPYRVTATAPGCGVIDVLPASTSRDMLGREKINSLDEYFLIHYGGEDSIVYQKARNAFVQSMAAYSVVTYLLQFKDRHNGNIMVDEEGHILHIDFGFILNIAPGGITFENAPFKLTTEMVNVMGGNANEQSFKWFSELCIKAYLASRPYADQIIQMVALMLGSELPCFKGQKTIKDLHDRFQLDKTEREAAEHMQKSIAFSYMNRRTVLYDSFQKLTNGIPY